MQNIKKTFLTSALIIVSIFAYAQSVNTYSPYSRYGVGQIPTRGFASTKGMGGISQAVRNPFGINYLNPASYTAQDSMSFILDFGMETGVTKYETLNQSAKNGSGGIHHVAISFPMTKWWGASFGIVPYSHVGYKIKDYETDPILLSSIGRIKYYHSGEGGINQVFLGNAFKLKNLSVGFNLSYFFGSLDYINEIVYPADKQSYYANFKERNSIVIGDVALSIGAQYTLFINKQDNNYFQFGATLDNESNIRAKRKYFAQSELSGNADTVSFKDSTYGHITFPRNISIGAAYNYKNKIFTSIEYSTQDWSNSAFLGVKQPLSNSQTYRFGVEYTPNRNDLKSYFKRVNYRFGSHYTNSYIKINNNQINEYGVSAGLGFPFRNNTRFNVSFEWGRRGTTNDNLVRETYGLVSFSLTFYDFWFIKRKYN
ncbi:MAG: hypothetical protein HXX16_15505 [Bacteroidales bacterium]|nr:hypothetical protein [Bacteroidales bacterium]